MKTYLNTLLCDAAPENGKTQRELMTAIMDGKIRLREDNIRHDLHRCRQWLNQRTHPKRRSPKLQLQAA